MLTPQKILNQLTGTAMAEAMIALLTEKFPDFAEDRQRYLAALKEIPGAEAEMQAIEQQTVSNLLFAGALGLKANWDHFTDPVARSFLDVDCEVYLREETARRMPAYQQAQDARERFYGGLSDAQRALYADVSAYTSHLETVVPKIAHYYGYILANTLLTWVIPGYHADAVQTARYTRMLEEYLGTRDLKTVQGKV